MPLQFGTKLRAVREHYHFPQKVFAQMLDLDHSSLSNLESGRRLPSLALAVRIAVHLGISVDYLLRDNIPVDASVSAEKVLAVREQRSTYGFETLGERIRRLRLASGLLQADFARSLGLASHSHVSYLESGRKEPSIKLLIQIADYFEMSVDDLIRGTSLAGSSDERPS